MFRHIKFVQQPSRLIPKPNRWLRDLPHLATLIDLITVLERHAKRIFKFLKLDLDWWLAGRSQEERDGNPRELAEAQIVFIQKEGKLTVQDLIDALVSVGNRIVAEKVAFMNNKLASTYKNIKIFISDYFPTPDCRKEAFTRLAEALVPFAGVFFKFTDELIGMTESEITRAFDGLHNTLFKVNTAIFLNVFECMVTKQATMVDLECILSRCDSHCHDCVAARPDMENEQKEIYAKIRKEIFDFANLCDSAEDGLTDTKATQI